MWAIRISSRLLSFWYTIHMKTFFFDFDGVIADSFQVAFEETRKLHKIYDLPEIDTLEFKNLFNGNFWDEHAKYGLDKGKEEDFKQELFQNVEKRDDEISFFEGMKDMLEQLSQAWHEMYILSSNKSSSVENKLRAQDLNGMFAEIIGGETPGNKEEKIQGIINGKHEVFFITDTVGDLKEVQNLPVKTIAITWGFHDEKELKKCQPNFIVKNPEELYETAS